MASVVRGWLATRAINAPFISNDCHYRLIDTAKLESTPEVSLRRGNGSHVVLTHPTLPSGRKLATLEKRSENVCSFRLLLFPTL